MGNRRQKLPLLEKLRINAPRYTQPMDTYKQRYLDLISRWKEYSLLQEQLRKDRRIILLCACVVCLFIGFMAGMILFYPKEHVVVSVQVPESQSEVKSELISL